MLFAQYCTLVLGGNRLRGVQVLVFLFVCLFIFFLFVLVFLESKYPLV